MSRMKDLIPSSRLGKAALAVGLAVGGPATLGSLGVGAGIEMRGFGISTSIGAGSFPALDPAVTTREGGKHPTNIHIIPPLDAGITIFVGTPGNRTTGVSVQPFADIHRDQGIFRNLGK